jgi:hypothetical protein
VTRLSTRRAGIAAAMLLAALGSAGGAAGATAPSPPRLTKPVNATSFNVDPERTYSAPVFVVDPEQKSTVLASYVEMRSKRCGLLRSTDYGQHWKALDQGPALPSYPFCFTANGSVLQTPLAFGRHHTLYYAFAGWDTQDNPRTGNVSVMLGRSTDLGDTWQTTIVANARGKQGDDTENNRPVQGLAVDTTSGAQDIVYVAWRQNHPVPQSPNAVPSRPMVAVSTDGGKAFGDPVNLAAGLFDSPQERAGAYKTSTTPPPAEQDKATSFGGQNPFVTLDGKGTVYVVWPTGYANFATANRPANAIHLSKSTDHGKTFTAGKIVDYKQGNPDFGSLRMLWSPQGGPDGTLHLISEGTDRPEIANEKDVFYRRSTDGGRTWTKKILNDDDPAQVFFQFDPNIAMAPDGRLDVVWWDTRDAAALTANDVYYTSSADNGLTWSKNLRVTDKSVDRTVGVWLNNFNVDSQPGLVSTNAYALVGWDDTRNTDKSFKANSELGGGLQDVYTSALQYRTVAGGTSKVAKGVLAGVVGLLVVALILLVAAFAGRRRTETGRLPTQPTPEPNVPVT